MRDWLLEGHAAQGRDFLAGSQLQKAVDGGLHEIDRIVAAVRLGEDVVDAGALEDVADAGPRLDAGARPGRHEDHLAGAESADDLVRNRVAAEADLPLPLQGFL